MVAIGLSRLENLCVEVRRAISFSQPELQCLVVDGCVFVEGTYFLPAVNSEVAAYGPLATYNIKLVFDVDFPEVEPLLYEQGGAFPHDLDHHVNFDGSCCYGVWELLLIEYPDMSIKQFLEGPVRSYFFGQHYLAMVGEWPFGELSHGERGILEACSKLLGCSPNRRVVEGLLRLLSRKWKRDRHPCTCGSKKKLRDCCRPILNEVPTRIHYKDARRLLWRLQKYPKS